MKETPDFIPQCKPLFAYESDALAILERIRQILASGQYILGEQVSAFEEEFAKYIGMPKAVAVANGTDAIEIALRTMYPKNGFVFVPSFTAIPTVAAIHRAGLQPWFVDVSPDSLTIDPTMLDDSIQYARITFPRTEPVAILPVHLYGHPAEMHSILEIAKEWHLPVVEDCAQAHGAEWDDRKLGSIGDVSCFSFYPTKNLPSFGDAGIVLFRSIEKSENARMFRQYGWSKTKLSRETGMNSRMDEMQAAILRLGLPKLNANNNARRAIAEQYDLAFNGSEVETPFVADWGKHVYHQYIIRCDRRNELEKFLQNKNIATARHYLLPAHLQPAYRYVPSLPSGLPESERATHRVLSLPMWPGLNETQQARVIDAILEFYGNK